MDQISVDTETSVDISSHGKQIALVIFKLAMASKSLFKLTFENYWANFANLTGIVVKIKPLLIFYGWTG
jgi:hypothetical protein